MIHGVNIGGTDTLTAYGLMLLADLTIGTPTPKTVFAEIPGRNGSIDLSYIVSDGIPTYSDRTITFNLFKSVGDASLDDVYNSLCALCHGQRKTLKLPIDNSHHFVGRFSIGDRSGYNQGKIPVTVLAEPFFYKDEVTTVTKTMSGTSTTVTLSNEGVKVSPEITTDKAITITFDGVQYSIPAGTITVEGIKLNAGDNVLSITGSSNTNMSFSYQEARI